MLVPRLASPFGVSNRSRLFDERCARCLPLPSHYKCSCLASPVRVSNRSRLFDERCASCLPLPSAKAESTTSCTKMSATRFLKQPSYTPSDDSIEQKLCGEISLRPITLGPSTTSTRPNRARARLHYLQSK